MTNTVSKIISDETLNKIITIESGGDPKAKAKTSSATGLFQFIDDTWLDMIKRYRPDLTRGKSKAQILALRKDPTTSIEMGAHFTEENAATLGAGYADGDLYLAHFLGGVVAEQCNRVDERQHGVAHRARFGDMHAARAAGGEHEADAVHAELAGESHVADAGKTAELDPGAE